MNEQEESKEASCSLFASIGATLNRNDTGYNWGLVYGNIAASDRGSEPKEVAQEPGLDGKNQKHKIEERFKKF